MKFMGLFQKTPEVLSTPSDNKPVGAPNISPRPCAAIYTQNSVLTHQEITSKDLRYAGERPRVSTCTGVAWFADGKRILAVDMHGCAMNIYEFNSEKLSLSLSERITNEDGACLARPENAVFSSDSNLLAVPNMSSGNINVYSAGPKNLLSIEPQQTYKGRQAHGVRFSPDCRFLMHVSTSETGVTVFDVATGDETQKLGLPFSTLTPKSLDFSTGNKWVVIGYCRQVLKKKVPPKGLLAVHHYDENTGFIDPKPVNTVPVDSVESLKFYPNSNCFFTVDQINDRVEGHALNVETGEVENSWSAIEGVESGLNIPHGVDFSHDGEFAAVTSYRDDKFTVYKVSN